jgi:hypothetical protein
MEGSMSSRSIVSAWEHFEFAVWSYRVSIVGAQLTALEDVDRIGALIKGGNGFQPGDGWALHNDPFEVKSAAIREVGRSFTTYRKFVLISACAAMEHLWKATFVEATLRDSGVLAELDVKLTLAPADVIGLTDEEKLFAVADELYRSPSRHRKNWSHFDRFDYLVASLLPLSASRRLEVQAWLKETDKELFNEAFQVRNRLVHGGGLADRRLGARLNFQTGEDVALTPSAVDGYLSNFEYVGTALVNKVALEQYEEP